MFLICLVDGFVESTYWTTSQNGNLPHQGVKVTTTYIVTSTPVPIYSEVRKKTLSTIELFTIMIRGMGWRISCGWNMVVTPQQCLLKLLGRVFFWVYVAKAPENRDIFTHSLSKCIVQTT